MKEYKHGERLMGNRFEITVVSDDERRAKEDIDKAVAEIKRIEKLLTTFSEESETARVNANAGLRPVEVSEEVFNLVARAEKISSVTDGAFDLSYGSLDKRLWNFDQTMTKLPDESTARAMVQLINYRNIILDAENKTIYLKEKGMRIGFGGIGKGYAAEMAKAVLINAGVKSGIVNASGDMTVWGSQANGKKWTVGIADPDNAATPFSYLEITDMAVATSGNYEKFILIGGKKYSHTINPKTGMPITGIKSVTVFSPNAEIADAMATPIAVMGVKAGLNLADQITGLECIIIDDNNKIYCSKNINLVEKR